MRIGSSLPLLPTTVSDRGYNSARSSRPAEVVEPTVEAPPSGEVTRIRRAVNAVGDALQNLSDRNLPQRSRDALQSYLANGPTLSERLGVELAGIDVLV